ncbi:MAG: hypothetical protein GTO14_01065 [Anaerolineales bacterium]|nr:hypothetical protein [Anaerolineales bacterium]
MHDDQTGRNRPPLIWVLILLVAAILILGDLNRRMAETRRLERDAQDLQSEVAAKETENAILKTQVAEATSEERAMQWAHEHGGMVRPGEILVVPITPPDTEIGPTATPTPVPEPPSNWEVWFALLFGE